MLAITGATGHSGYWLIKKLEASGFTKKIRCLTRASSNCQFLESSNLDIEIVRGDLDNYQFIKESTKDTNCLIHIATIDYSKKITDAAMANSVDWTIFVHTTGRYSKFKSASEGYIAAENYVKDSSISHTIIRPTMIYGSHKDRNMWKLVDFLHRRQFFPIFGQGKNLMQPIHARDLGYAIFDVLKNKNLTKDKDYNIAGKDAITYKNLLQTVSHQLGRTTNFIHLPISLSAAGAYIGNKLTSKFPISVEQVMRMNEDKAFDYSDATKDFGYSPISFEEGIKEEVEEYLSYVKTGKLREFN